MLTRENLVQDNAQGPTIDFVVIGLLSKTLWSNTVNRANLRAWPMHLIVDASHAKVRQLQHHLTCNFLIHQEIFQFYVTVNHIILVAGVDRVSHLEEKLTRLLLWQPLMHSR